MLQSYKCRFELTGDMDEAIRVLENNNIDIIEIRRGTNPFNDDEWEFMSFAPLNKLIEVLKKGMDLHIIYESLELKENYTGERKIRW